MRDDSLQWIDVGHSSPVRHGRAGLNTLHAEMHDNGRAAPTVFAVEVTVRPRVNYQFSKADMNALVVRQENVGW
jgi:hypothetical protein